MTEEKLLQMYFLAERVVAKSAIRETRFSESSPWLEGDIAFPRNLVIACTEGSLRGRTFAAWLPIAKAMYDDEALREMIITRARDTWRRLAISELLPLSLLTGPRGKLP